MRNPDSRFLMVPRSFSDQPIPQLRAAVEHAVSRVIFSASGWRSIFAADGDEESTSGDVAPALLVVAGLAAACFAERCGARPSGSACARRLALATDTRPTGPAIARAALRVLLEAGLEVDYLGVSPSPETMAYAGRGEEIDGFFYVTASHNPIGHNGFKTGGSDGGVLDAAAARSFEQSFRAALANDESLRKVVVLLAAPPSTAEAAALRAMSRHKARAQEVYEEFSHEVIRGPGPHADRAYRALLEVTRAVQPGIVGDLNGSARAASVDRRLLAAAGCRLRLLNDRPGQIAHQIVPEGAGLTPCRDELLRLRERGEEYELGYVPDNDGDRGNLVYYDEQAGMARQLEAQQVFALTCVAELSWLVYTGELDYDDDGKPRRRVAVVVNGPTSLRIDRIAASFGVEVHRTEVGEANVVNRARELRREGAIVRLLGEGSNGGNITHPSAVRDPLHTIHAVLKLRYAPPAPWSPSPAQIWLTRLGLPPLDNPTIATLLSTLPRFTTTSSFEPRAVMHIRSRSHASLKERFEAGLEREFEALRRLLPAELRVRVYRIINYERTVVREGRGHRTGEERGGLTVLLLDDAGVERGFLWMRGSGTEPVFRILADVEGDRPQTEHALLERLRALVEQADAQSAAEATSS